MKKAKNSMRILAMLLALLMVLGILPTSALAAGGEITVFMSFEGYNLGHGFYIEPTAITLPAGQSAADATERLLNDTDHDFRAQGSGATFFLSAVEGFNRDYINPPSYINSAWLSDCTEDGGWLGTGDYSSTSGWMITVNHHLIQTSAGVYTLSDGDVIRWQFSVEGLGADLGVACASGMQAPLLFTHADKTVLIQALFAPSVDATARQAALDVIINPLATPAQVAEALTALSTQGQDRYENGWFIVYDPNGNLQERLLTLVEERDNLQPLLLIGERNPDNAMIRNRLAVVERLRVVGTMHTQDFRPGAATANFSQFAALLGESMNGNGTNVDHMALLHHLVEIDLSGVSDIVDASGALPGAAFRGLRNLERARLPQQFGFRTTTFLNTPRLTTLSFGNDAFIENVFDFRGLGVLTFTGNNFQNSGAREVIFPTGITSIPANMFNSNRDLHTVRFYGTTAPSIVNTAFNSITPRPVAIVPDHTTGGYQLFDFYRNFLQVRTDRTAFGLVIAEAEGLNQVFYTLESWTALQTALSDARAVYNNTEALRTDIDTAAANLRTAIDALAANVTFIDVPAGATVRAVRKIGNHFQEFTVFPMNRDPVRSCAERDVFAAEIPLGTAFHIEAFIPGETALMAQRRNALTAHGTTITLNPTPLSAWTNGQGPAWQDANVLTNLDDTGTINLAVGQSFYLDTFRAWQAMDGVLLNYFIEPEYTFDLFGDSVAIERVGGPGRERLRITARTPGTSVIEATYGPVEYIRTNGSRLVFDGMDPRNTLAVVVNVDGGAAFNTGITVRNDFDTYFFDTAVGYRSFTFTPDAGSEVRVHEPLNLSDWGYGWVTYTATADGSFTVTLRDGRNIVEIRNGGAVRYHVIHARGVSVSVMNESRPGQPFAANDIVRIEISGLLEPIEKLAGIYNPGFGSALQTRARYTDGVQNFDSSPARQFEALTHTFLIRFFFGDAEANVLTGHITAGAMGSEPGAHRDIPLGGVGANMNALARGPFAFGALPEIVLQVPVDRTALSAAITAAEARNQALYTSASWTNLQTVLGIARITYNTTEATQTDVETAAANLQTAIGTLVLEPTIDRTALSAAITAAEARNQALYTSASWTNLQTVLGIARITYNTTEATQTDVETAAANLQTAIGALVLETAPPIEYIPYMNAALSWIRTNTPQPEVGSVGGEWAVLALARGGVEADAWFAAYLTSLASTLPSGSGLQVGSWTDHARVTLALSALGFNAADYNGHDLTAPFRNFVPVANRPNLSRTINADIWALIALDARPYEGDRQALIASVLDAQQTSGAWGLTATIAPGIDITAMAIQALAPYYDSNPAVKAAVDQALAWLENQTITDAEGNAQMIVALSALGRDAEDYVAALLTFRNPATGAFRRSGADNAMATEQAAYALVAYHRFRTDQNRLYDMRDAVQSDVVTPVNREALQSEITRAEERIQADYTAASWNAKITALASARLAYADTNATQIQVNIARNALHAAINALVRADSTTPINRDALRSEITRAEGRTQANYTATSWTAMATALASARLAYADTGATQAQVDTARDALQVAINALVRTDDTTLADRTALRSEITRAEGRTQANYTVASWAAMTTALASARLVYADAGATQAQVDTARDVLHAAVNALVRVEREGLTVEIIREILEGNGRLTVTDNGVTISFDRQTLAALVAGEAADTEVRVTVTRPGTNGLNASQMSIVGNRPAFTLTVMVGNRTVRNFGGTVTVTLPYMSSIPQAERDLLTVYHVGENGAVREMMGARYDRLTVTFTTSSFSTFFINEWRNPFADVARSSWYLRSVRFAYTHGLKEGTAPGQFSPNVNLSRAMIVTILWRAEGEPIRSGGNPFSDVRSGRWYSEAIAWASANGIVHGYGDGRFGPADYITREQLAVILRNYARFTGANTTAGAFRPGFTDVNTVSDWALDAMRWANANDLITGRTPTTLVPRGTATRAESATILQRFMEVPYTPATPENVTPSVNRTNLRNTIATADGRTQANYTPASWNAMSIALTSARAIYNNANATQAQVDTARTTLQSAINGLVPVSTGNTSARAFISVIDPNAGAGQTSVFFAGQYFNIIDGETVYDLLRRIPGLTISARGPANNRYVESINGFGEFDDGPLSGWMYRVNGVFPDRSASQFVLRNGDRVEWLFTRDLGSDIGGSFSP